MKKISYVCGENHGTNVNQQLWSYDFISNKVSGNNPLRFKLYSLIFVST